MKYAQEVGWTFVPRDDAEKRRGFNSAAPNPSLAAQGASLYFDDVLFENVGMFNPHYKEAAGALAAVLAIRWSP